MSPAADPTNSNTANTATSDRMAPEKKLQTVDNYMSVSFFGLFTCLLTLVLAFLFKEHLINLLTYLEEKSSSNIVEFHLILLLLYVLMSLPVLSPYLICVLISSYVYGFFCSVPLVILYTVVGMTISFFMCRYMFSEYAHAKVKRVLYLHAICSLIQSNEKGTVLWEMWLSPDICTQ
jgi:uncharacterized membrane protein YdjX (TVP38/TMEM64 family)